MQVKLEPRALRFARPLQTAYGSLEQRELILLTLSEDGLSGRGESAPLEPYDGVAMADALAALDAYRPVLEASDHRPRPDVLAACRAIADLPQALAAVDVALWELEARRAQRPLADLLSLHPLNQINLNASVDAGEPVAAADAAADAARRGFRSVKLKVGSGDDVSRVMAARAAVGPQVALRLDANGAWSLEQAVSKLEALAGAQPELVEEPVHGLAPLRELRAKTQLALAIDETASDPEALSAGIADAVCLKLSRCGGVSGLLDAAAAARAAGSHVYVGSTYDGPVGIAAAMHAAAAIDPDYACGLATLGLFEGWDDWRTANGAIEIPAGPGLGI